MTTEAALLTRILSSRVLFYVFDFWFKSKSSPFQKRLVPLVYVESFPKVSIAENRTYKFCLLLILVFSFLSTYVPPACPSFEKFYGLYFILLLTPALSTVLYCLSK